MDPSMRGDWLMSIAHLAALARDVFLAFEQAGFDHDHAFQLTLLFMENAHVDA